MSNSPQPRRTIDPEGELTVPQEMPAAPLPLDLQKPKHKNRNASKYPVAFGVGATSGIIYALLTRLLFGSNFLSGITLETMSFGFLGFVPMGLGALTVFFTPPGFRASYRYSFFISWLTVTIFFIIAGIVSIEATICLIMASPIFLAMSSVGGLIMCWVLRQVERLRTGVRTKNYLIAVLLVAPYLISPLESQIPAQNSFRRVESQITINSTPEKVWQNIIRVSTIQPEEQSFSLSHLFEFPRPVAATLSSEGVGGVRDASFADGLRFIETVTEWQPLRTIQFTIAVNTSGVLNSPFDQIGGKYFDVLDGAYTLEPTTDGRIILHLVSHERLTTRFNAYGGWWTDFIMNDLQNNILEIVKHRAES